MSGAQLLIGVGPSGGAELSDCGLYRYRLWRRWDNRPHVLFVGNNPSTADAMKDDHTARRWKGFAQRGARPAEGAAGVVPGEDQGGTPTAPGQVGERREAGTVLGEGLMNDHGQLEIADPAVAELEPEAPPAAGGKPLWELLRQKYPADAYALFPEVRNATGFKGDRSADAVMMALWPSRGLEITGFEFKASRSDWKRELENPRKADGVCRYCDRWWIVAEKTGIVLPAELPKTWGLMVVNPARTGLRVVVPAPPLEAIPLDKKFVASLLRAAQDSAAKPLEAIRQQERDAAWREFNERAEKDRARAAETRRSEILSLQRIIDDFEKSSGVSIRRAWELPQIGAAVKAILENPIDVQRRLAGLAERAQEMADQARAGADALKALEVQRGEALSLTATGGES